MENQINEMLKSILEIEEVSPDTPLVDLGLSSIDFIKLVVAIEDQYDIQFDDNDLDPGQFVKVSDIYQYVLERTTV